jgi:hypothetical protein
MKERKQEKEKERKKERRKRERKKERKIPANCRVDQLLVNYKIGIITEKLLDDADRIIVENKYRKVAKTTIENFIFIVYFVNCFVLFVFILLFVVPETSSTVQVSNQTKLKEVKKLLFIFDRKKKLYDCLRSFFRQTDRRTDGQRETKRE